MPRGEESNCEIIYFCTGDYICGSKPTEDNNSNCRFKSNDGNYHCTNKDVRKRILTKSYKELSK